MKRHLVSLLCVLALALIHDADSEPSKSSLVWRAPSASVGETATCEYDSSANAILCRYLEVPNMELLYQALQETSQFVQSFGVDIQFSNGSAIPLGIFSGYDVSFLVLSDNGFGAIPYSLLSSIESSLDYLYIGYDIIPALASTTLYLPFSVFLTQLYIVDSGASDVSLAAFAQYAHLKTLSMSDNNFTTVGLPLIGLETLEELDLQNCYIASIETGAFRDLGKLRTIHLNGNKLANLQEGAFLGLEVSPISQIDLADNPWNCNCALQWMKDWLNQRNLTTSSGAICALPVVAPFEDVQFCNETIEKSVRA